MSVRRITPLINFVRAERGLDPRLSVFDVRVRRREAGLTLVGESTDDEAMTLLLDRIGSLEDAPEVIDEVVRLPDPGLDRDSAALVRAAVAPVMSEPRVSATQVSQYVLGHRLEILSMRDGWCRARGEDGYIGWVHPGYLEVADGEWARQWELGEDGEPAVSLGAELVDEAGRVFARLPWGSRLIRDQPRHFRIPDGRRGALGEGEVIAADRLSDRFPARGESVTRTARLWWGTPYIWGGVTPLGADCSGFVQSIFWMHGIALPRDSDLQAHVGMEVEIGDETELRPGDLLFFTEEAEAVSHVAISMGGFHIIHCSLANGGVEFNHLEGDLAIERRLKEVLVGVRRVLPD